VSPGLPPLLCDTTRIRQVVINLLSNAGRFTGRGGVRVKAWRDRGEIVVSVADTGPGIAPEDQEKLFTPFYQVDGSIRRRHGGSGLGLSICKRFVEMHGGRVWFESPSARSDAGGGGPGTTFYFSLPLEGPPAADLVRADQVTRWLSHHGGLEYRTRTGPSKAPAPTIVPRFVILERGETLRRLFNRYVQGVEAIPVKRIEDALGELGRSPAQALIVNAPPFAEPLASVSQLSSLPYGTPAVTCWVPGGAEVAERLGVVHYLVKPVTREALLSALGTLGEGVRSLLLVDDDPGVLQLFARMLEETQGTYRILRARSGQRALDLLRKRRPDAMLLDLVMPGLDGFQVLREKSQDPAIRDVPVVVVSSRDPTGEPAISDTFTVARSGGLPARDLVACIQAVSEILTPSTRPADRARPPDRGQPETPGA
jgi:CheY-like chemotaxis protein